MRWRGRLVTPITLVSTLVPHVDFFICETMSSIAESINATDAVLRFGGGRPVYLSWTLDETPGEGLRSGESVAQAFAAVSDRDIAGYSFNCTTPEAICSAIAELRPLTGKPIGCYANRIERVPEGWTLDNDLQYIRPAIPAKYLQPVILRVPGGLEYFSSQTFGRKQCHTNGFLCRG